MRHNTRKAEGLEDACWEGYEAVGMKEKDGKQVPNCVSTKTAAERVAARHAHTNRVAYEPPFHNAAKADEALGEAYRSLIDLKLGFDSWNEIPQSAMPLYQEIMKAVDSVVTARQTTTQVRAMVARKRY